MILRSPVVITSVILLFVHFELIHINTDIESKRTILHLKNIFQGISEPLDCFTYILKNQNENSDQTTLHYPLTLYMFTVWLGYEDLQHAPRQDSTFIIYDLIKVKIVKREQNKTYLDPIRPKQLFLTIKTSNPNFV